MSNLGGSLPLNFDSRRDISPPIRNHAAGNDGWAAKHLHWHSPRRSNKTLAQEVDHFTGIGQHFFC